MGFIPVCLFDHIFGHAAYTRLNAMPFNTSEIVESLYRNS
jgi:hypothetical protein